MKCDLCDKAYGVLTIMAGQTVKDQEIEDKIRNHIEELTEKKIASFPRLCQQHLTEVLKSISTKKS